MSFYILFVKIVFIFVIQVTAQKETFGYSASGTETGA